MSRKLLVLPLMLCCLAAQAQDFESPERIRSIARDYAQQSAGVGTQVEATSLDERLRLPACSKAPSAFMPQGNNGRGAITVGVRCDAPVAWTLYVPVRISQTMQVLVLNRSLNRGELITADMISFQSRDTATLPYGYLSKLSDATGKTLKRPLVAGSVLSPDAMEMQRIIKRGQSVTVFSHIGGLEVRAQGTALSDAGQGDRLRVENKTSRRVVEGVVINADSIEVAM
ncbi:MAG: flagellar basal body P-ring formation chaperone FlgA [Pseudomonadota bacterium]